MRVTKEIYSVVKTYASIIIMGVIAVADYIWEDRYFTCPCVKRPLRIAFCVSFVLSPAIFLILADCNCSVLRVTCKHFSCDTFCRKWSVFLRPIILAGAWTIYSIMNPRFSECIENERFLENNQTFNCTPQDQRASWLKSWIAISILCASVSIVLIKMLCHRCCNRNQPTEDVEQTIGENEKDLKKLLKDKGLTGQTLTALEEEGLLSPKYFKTLEDYHFKMLESKINIGQMVIVKEYYKKKDSPDAQVSSEVTTEIPHDAVRGNPSGSTSHAAASQAVGDRTSQTMNTIDERNTTVPVSVHEPTISSDVPLLATGTSSSHDTESSSILQQVNIFLD